MGNPKERSTLIGPMKEKDILIEGIELVFLNFQNTKLANLDLD